MIKQNNYLDRNRKAIIIVSIVAHLIALFITTATMAYGFSSIAVPFLALYATFITSTILVVKKIRLGYFLTLLTATIYMILLTKEVGSLFTEIRHTLDLIFYLLPYIAFQALILLSIAPLSAHEKVRKAARFISLIIIVACYTFIVIDRSDYKFPTHIDVKAKLTRGGKMTLLFLPPYSDTETISTTVKRKELAELTDKLGEPNNDMYHSIAKITLNYRFSEIKSITILQIGGRELANPLTWTKEEIHGNLKELLPY